MSESCQEQHPLLCEDLSEEDQYIPQYKRRFRPMTFRSGASNNIKGAATIIKRWPDHWYTTAIYWWLGIGMIAITILIIYNGMIAFALLPPEQITIPKYPTENNAKRITTDKSLSLPMVYMHVFINSINDVDITKYLPYIEIISNKYFDYKYRLIFVVNDNDDNHAPSAEENNEIALNTLIDKSHIHENLKYINIEQVNLSEYMNSSPLKKYWRTLPKQFIEFLVRGISVWEKGGIAFNPVILTPYSPNAIYIEKLQGILKEYKDNSKQNIRNITILETKTNSRKIDKKPAKKTNNIRDIIDALDQNDVEIHNQYNMAEAEDKEIPTLVKHSVKKQTKRGTKDKLLQKGFEQNSTLNEPITYNNQDISVMPSLKQNANIENNKINLTVVNNNTAHRNLLPLFLKFLFNEKTTAADSRTENIEELKKKSLTRKRKSVIPTEGYKINNSLPSITNINTEKNETGKYKPMIISTSMSNGNVKNMNVLNEFKYYDGQLIIDLKGNMVATKTSCHAFIGTVFNNVIHHTENESVTDFIVNELSSFCKGLLSTCNGIDVILL